MTVQDFDWWPSPAKINLFLHICGRFENGYHDLQTLFQLLDYGDEVGFSINSTGQISLLDNIDGLPEEDNLIFKAASLLFPLRKDQQYGVNIRFNKRIPAGGGLGGGSSNAATTLLALNQLWQCDCDKNTLMAMAKQLGADVPVFVNGQTTFASGIGDKFYAYNQYTNASAKAKLADSVFLVATPKIHVSTQAVFTHPDLPRSTQKIDYAEYDFEKTHNDCEILVANLYPEVANLLQWLLHYAPSRMTGTGASVFAVFKAREQAEKVMSMLPESTSAFIAKGIESSPVLNKHAK